MTDSRVEESIQDPCTAGAVARLDERIKSLWDAIAAAERANSEAVRIAADRLEIRLEHLNGEQGRIAQINASMVTREVFEVKQQEIVNRLHRIEADFHETRGRLWLPMIVAAGVAAGLGAAVAKLL